MIKHGTMMFSIFTGNFWDMSSQYDIWVCLELGYTVWYTVYPEVVAFLIRKVMINHSLWGDPIFRQAHVVDPCHGPATTRPLNICFSRTATLRKRTCHESRWFQLLRHESNCCSRHPKQALWTGTNIYIYIWDSVFENSWTYLKHI